MKTKIILTFLIIALIAITGCMEGNTINVQGNSEITVDPDEAEVWVGVSIVKFVSAEAAQSEANKVINDIINGLKNRGIPESDIQTENLMLNEERKWENGNSRVVGWRAMQTLKVKTTELNEVGFIVDVAVKNGANQINNIQFGLSEEKEQMYKRQVLAEATKNAKEKAETIAQSLDARLGRIKTVSESNYFARPYIYTMEKTVGVAAVEEAAMVMPSDVRVTANINLIYYIR
tara:strand:- start:181 stop:879 length:699 start_codon:yes stop_codon:yes gene_type:complete